MCVHTQYHLGIYWFKLQSNRTPVGAKEKESRTVYNRVTRLDHYPSVPNCYVYTRGVHGYLDEGGELKNK